MSWENEKQDYVRKLENIINGLEKINSISQNRIITKEVEKALNTHLATAKKLMPKIKEGKFEVAVVGLEKAGKSSFSNALMEMDILPTDEQRCTYTSTCIEASDSDSAIITFYTEQDFRRDFKEKLDKLGIKDADLYSYDSLTLERYIELFDDCDDYIKKEFEDSLNEDIKNIIENKNQLKRYIGSPRETMAGDVLTNDSFKSYITDPGKAIAVQEVRIFSSHFDAMPDATIYDVPGFNSPTAMHREQTIEKMRSVDVIVMVAKADEPSITGDVLSIFRESDEDGAGLSDKLFIFANKADRATKLEKNKEKTYDEWINKRRILTEEYKNSRFFFGSANAHLGEKVENGLAARKALEDKGYTDGIIEFRKALVEYYKSERFEVLKKRVDRIIFDIKSIFKDIREEHKLDTDVNLSQKEIVGMSLELSADLSKNIIKELNRHKDELNNYSRTELPLQGKIGVVIDENITVDNYHISDELISEIHKSVAGISSSEDPRRVDVVIRKQKFEQMYNDFYSDVIGITDTEHKTNCEKIADIFMDSMDISHNSNSYSVLKDRVIEFCGLDDVGNEETDKKKSSYYQSLIERFARDIYEILIKFSHDTGRLNKFRDENANFLSLGIYYNAAEAAESDNKLSYIRSTPEQSSLWRILLYPEVLSCQESKLWDVLMQTVGVNKNNAEKTLGNLFNKLILKEGENAVLTLKNVLNKVVSMQGHPEIEIVMDIADALKSEVGWGETEDSTLEGILKDELSYENEVNARRSQYTYVTVQKEFDDDIVALQRILKRAVLNAISIDKAFSARETRIIEKIIQSIESNSKEFRDFIMDNIDLIKSRDFERIHEENAQKEADIAVMNQIDRILTEIK